MIEYLAAGATLGLSAGLAPGPLFALVISQSLGYGTREGAKIACVPLLTDAPVILLSLAAMGRIERFPAGTGCISVLGGLFVLYLAWENLRARGPGRGDFPTAPCSIRRGVAVNLLNPHLYLFWFTVGAPLTLRGWMEGPSGAAAFVGGFYVCLVGSKTALAALAGYSRRRIGGSAYRRLIRALGVLLAFFGITLVRNGISLLCRT